MTKSIHPYTRIFVYGSLMRDMGNHRILRKSQFVSATTIRPGPDQHFAMVDLGAFPGLVDTESGYSQQIVGEMYYVKPDVLEALDRLEGAPDFYERRPVQLACGTLAETYVLNRANRTSAWRVMGKVADWRKHTSQDRIGTRWTYHLG